MNAQAKIFIPSPFDHKLGESAVGDSIPDERELERRRIILDNLLLSSPVVVAQRIRVEQTKECMKFPEILLPSTLIL